MSMHDPEPVLAFWLGAVDTQGRAPAATASKWWMKSDAFDAEIKERFEPVYDSVCDGACAGWLDTARHRVAYVIVLDQFSRNMFRDTPKMYAEDARAQRVVLEGLAAGCDRDLGLHARYFFYMPLMHAEDRALQDRCVALFQALEKEFPDDGLDQAVKFAVSHRDIVHRFGRFPHRNALLGRPSTEDELEFLKTPGSSF